MPTIKFDWNKWNQSLWYGFRKNRMYLKVRDGGNDVNGEPTHIYDENDLGDPVAPAPEVEQVRQNHMLAGYRSDTWFDKAGDVADANWQDHFKAKVESAGSYPPPVDSPDPNPYS